MALANLALIMPNVNDDTKATVTDIHERMQQLQAILQELPPDPRADLLINGRRSSLRRSSPLKTHSRAKTPPVVSPIEKEYKDRKMLRKHGSHPQLPDLSRQKTEQEEDPFLILNPESRRKTPPKSAKKVEHMPPKKTISPKAKQRKGNVFTFEEKKAKTQDLSKSDTKLNGSIAKDEKVISPEDKKDKKTVNRTENRDEKKYVPKECSGMLSIQAAHGQWRNRWCRYKDGILECRYEEKGSVAARMRVGFCMLEIQDIKFNESKNDDLYWCYLESQQAFFCFKVFATDRAHVFRAQEGSTCKKFVDIITKDLQARLSAELWQKKVEAAREIIPLCREQFIIQMTNHQLLINSLSSSGFLQSYLPITSMNKEKSGVLGMETDDGWREYYFVLFEGALYYYQDSKSTTPAGFITLRFATVELDQKSLAQGKFVFHIRTPLRKVSCKARHSVSLSEWVASLETSINLAKKGNKDKKKLAKSEIDVMNRKSSYDILENINQLLVNIDTMDALCKNQAAMETFRNWLMDEKNGGLNNFDFYQDNEKLKSISSAFSDGHNPDTLVTKADRMFHKYFSEGSECQLKGLDQKIIDEIQVALQSPTGGMFDKVAKIVYPALRQAFTAFKKSPDFAKLTKKLVSKTVMDHREVAEFPMDSHQSFLLKAKGSKRTKEIKLNRKTNMVTIGRDKSNFVVIEDSRVSRSHARVEYTATQCEYIDLGSSCGSKLNGRPVLRAKLKPGDLIEIGMSVLIFSVKKRRKSSLFQRLGIKVL
mmetsp:Transcript_7988/g.12073  ORF Transcript_7988/g.12073 Transcript_7988/m.12073 type:complete len:765 (-) Transcript_7988:73-2367(-)